MKNDDETQKATDLIMSMSVDFKQGKIDEDTYKSNLLFVAQRLTPVPFDSESETLKHIKRVNALLIFAATELLQRAMIHDESKFSETEKPLYDKLTPLLSGAKYGSDEYKQFLCDLKPALTHHYQNNSHHPEHYHGGINGFDLFDLIEMFFDWKAASERTKDGDIEESIRIGVERFKIDPQIDRIFRNTAFRYLTK